MEFLILGPIEVRSAASAVALGGIKPRAVLAVLLLHPNQPVSAERLALAGWGEDAPANAVKTVQVNISRLRQVLGDPDVITTTTAGYQLRVRPGELDAERFEDLVEDARRVLDARPADAAELLREALALWRGRALADLALEPFAGTEIARLEEQRLAALELRVDADLAASRHAEVVGELARLVVEHPMRERLAGQLMLALYRCGRQTEALEAYARTRRALVDEVGVEPGPQLRDLHEAILRQDAALELAQVDAALPAALDTTTAKPLVGREQELAWLRSRWERARGGGAGAIVALIGAPGAGKSRLTAELAQAIHEPGVAVMHATGKGPADTILVALRRLRDATRPTLLVVDDADGAGTGVHAELERLAPAIVAAPVLIVVCALDRRTVASVPAADTLELRALGTDAVREIAARYVPGRAAADVPADWLLQASGGIPRRVHDVAGQWARREAARHVGAVADRAEAGRAELRSIEQELVGGVVELQEARERATPGAGGPPVVCPFKGLASYDVSDAPYFFGREQLVAELVARLVGAPLLGVVGPSGSGKSSVLRAGLMPALASGVLPGSERWQQLLIRPGEHPLRELREARARVAGDARVLLAVDQFEETFTACEDERERAAFVAELVDAGRDPGGRYVVVLALRADFYGRCAAYPRLAGMLAASNVLVRSLQRDELRSAVEMPAQRAGLRIEPELVDALVDDVADEPGGLPLLSTALLELWQHRDGRRLRHASYERMGGVHGAVARLAEEAYGQLGAGQQEIARDVLMRLVGAGEGDAIERRRVALEELEIERDEDVARVVALLTDRRLLTVSAGTVELAHEALLREWPRLRGWVREDRDGLRIRRGLSAAAHEWDELRRDDGALYRGTRLAEAIEWRDARGPALNELERAFLAAAESARDRERVTRRRRTVLALGSAMTLLLAIVVVAVVVVLTKRERDIVASRDIAARSASVIGSNPGLALAVARAALDRDDTAQARAAVRQATLEDRALAVLPANEGKIYHLATSAKGHLAATADSDGSVRIWSLDRRRLLTTIKGKKDDAVYGVSISRDARHVAFTDAAGNVVVAGIDGRDRLTLVNLGDDPAPDVDFSPDGSTLVVGTVSGVLRLVRVTAAGRQATLHQHDGEVVFTVAFDPSGTHVVSASGDGTARVWDVAGGAPVTFKHPTSVLGASFSPDGVHLATSDFDGYVRIWRLDNASRPQLTIRSDKQAAYTVAYSDDARTLVSTGEDGGVRVFDAANGVLLSNLHGHQGPVNDAEPVPGSKTIVSAGEDGTLRLWSPPATLAIAHRAATTPNFSPDGRYVVTGDNSGGVVRWDLRTGRVQPLPGHSDVSYAFFSSDGDQVVSASEDGAVRLDDMRGGRSRRVPTDASTKYAAAVDRAGRLVAIAGETLVLERPDGSARRVLRGPRGLIFAVAFSPDGRHLVSGSQDGIVRIWNTATGRIERVLRGHDQEIEWASYSDDGTHVATASADGTVRVWPVDGGTPVVLSGHDGRVNSAQFSPDGRRVVSAGNDGTVRVWDARGGDTLVVLERYAGSAVAADFGPAGRVVSATDSAIAVTTCDVCGSMQSVLRRAATLGAYKLNQGQRERLLSDP
jgi:WD40 repeat protein/DNA-binding SARP family transcriptional activator